MNFTADVVIPVYNAADIVGETIETIARQQLPAGWQLRIYASDDGSTDATRDRLEALRENIPELRCVFAESNGGRSQACNAGVTAGNGSIVLIVDADCRYTRQDAIAEFIREVNAGRDAVIGAIEVAGTGFWARYGNSVTGERIDGQARLGLMAWSTQNIAIRRDVFERLGGYSTDYSRYGFEDKDFLIRLQRLTSNVAVRPDIRVRHDDDLDLHNVCRKAEESGRCSAPVFRSRHPREYGKLPYARCDATTNLRLRYLRFLAPLLRGTTEIFARGSLATPLPGFRAQRFMVRAAVCAAYFLGTTRSA